MARLILRECLARPGRTALLMLGIMAATASFTVLTGSSATSRLEVRGTVARNFRSSYDILVRPRGARTALEDHDGLVRPGALSGIAGGITIQQWRRVLGLPGISVAAPLASIGYALPSVELPIDLSTELDRRSSSLLRIDVRRTTDDGLTSRDDAPVFAYFTRRRLLPEPAGGGPSTVYAPRITEPDGQIRAICDNRSLSSRMRHLFCEFSERRPRCGSAC